MRVENGQSSRPNQLPNIRDVSDDGILEPPTKWQLRNRLGGTDLNKKGNDCGPEREPKQRNFLNNKFSPSLLIGEIRLCAFVRSRGEKLMSVQWPIVEQ